MSKQWVGESDTKIATFFDISKFNISILAIFWVKFHSWKDKAVIR